MQANNIHFVEHVSPEFPQIQARIAVIFGNANPALITQMAKQVAHMYLAGQIKKIIVTGGARLKNQRMTEAEHARKILLAHGISGKHILFENKSKNTYENVCNARRLLLSNEGQLKHEPVFCLGRQYAARRFLMTMKKNWPEAIPGFMGFDSFITPKNEWHTCPDISSLLVSDFNKWASYISKGHIKVLCDRRLRWDIHKANKIRKPSF